MPIPRRATISPAKLKPVAWTEVSIRYINSVQPELLLTVRVEQTPHPHAAIPNQMREVTSFETSVAGS